MRAFGILMCLFLLSGCVDIYTPVPGGTGSTAKLSGDIRECRKKASDIYLWDQGHGLGAVAFLAGGLAGGALGGAASGLAVSNKSPQPTLDQMVENCMRERGYIGTSKN